MLSVVDVSDTDIVISNINTGDDDVCNDIITGDGVGDVAMLTLLMLLLMMLLALL